MNAKDSVSAKLAECYVTLNGNRYNFMEAISLTATAKKNSGNTFDTPRTISESLSKQA